MWQRYRIFYEQNKLNMENFTNLSERIKQIIDYKKVSINKFSTILGASNSYFNKILRDNNSIGSDKLEKILRTFPEINAEWLLTGQGSMLKEQNNLPMAIPTYDPDEEIPLIPTEAMGGVASGEISILELDCERYVIPMFKGADFLIPVKGSSMIPKYNSGDIVACKKVPMQDIFFQWNKVYVLDTNQGAIIKRVAKSEEKDCIKIVSENPNYEPFDLHLSQIYSIAIVIGVVRQE